MSDCNIHYPKKIKKEETDEKGKLHDLCEEGKDNPGSAKNDCCNANKLEWNNTLFLDGSTANLVKLIESGKIKFRTLEVTEDKYGRKGIKRKQNDVYAKVIKRFGNPSEAFTSVPYSLEVPLHKKEDLLEKNQIQNIDGVE